MAQHACGHAYAQHRPFEGAECLMPMAGAFAASPEGLTSWVLHAGPDRLCIYARAPSVPRSVGARAQHLLAQGLITLRRTRHVAEPTLFDFAARRTALPFARARKVPIDAMLPSESRLLFDVLTRLADAGVRCPGNADLAAMIGVRSGNAVSKHLARLAEANLIAVTWDEDFAFRQIEMLETGAKTGGIFV